MLKSGQQIIIIERSCDFPAKGKRKVRKEKMKVIISLCMYVLCRPIWYLAVSVFSSIVNGPSSAAQL